MRWSGFWLSCWEAASHSHLTQSIDDGLDLRIANAWRIGHSFRMWLAHALTFSRLPIAIALTQTFGDRMWSAILVLLAAGTDAADGTVARWGKRRGSTAPDIGGWLDPLVDKLFVVIVLGTLWWYTHEVALIALIAAREILLAPLMLVYFVRGMPTSHLKARTVGKIATIAQFLACAVAVVDPYYAWPLAIAAAALGLAAIVDYIVHEARTPKRGITV